MERRLRRPGRPLGHGLAVERLLLDGDPGRGATPGQLEHVGCRCPARLVGGTVLPVASSVGFRVGDAITIGSGGNAENAVVSAVVVDLADARRDAREQPRLGRPRPRAPAEASRITTWSSRRTPAPPAACRRFGKSSEPALTSDRRPLRDRPLVDRSPLLRPHTTSFYGAPLVSWTPALGAAEYEVQWSKTQYPFRSLPAARRARWPSRPSVVLPVGTGHVVLPRPRLRRQPADRRAADRLVGHGEARRRRSRPSRS